MNRASQKKTFLKIQKYSYLLSLDRKVKKYIDSQMRLEVKQFLIVNSKIHSKSITNSSSTYSRTEKDDYAKAFDSSFFVSSVIYLIQDILFHNAGENLYFRPPLYIPGTVI